MPANMIETNAHESAQGVDIGALPDPNVPGRANRVTRRDFIRQGAVTAATIALGGCKPTFTPPTPDYVKAYRDAQVGAWHAELASLYPDVLTQPGLDSQSITILFGMDGKFKDYIPAIMYTARDSSGLTSDYMMVRSRDGVNQKYLWHQRQNTNEKGEVTAIEVEAIPTNDSQDRPEQPYAKIILKSPLALTNFSSIWSNIETFTLTDPTDQARTINIDPATIATDDKGKVLATLKRWATPTPPVILAPTPKPSATPQEATLIQSKNESGINFAHVEWIPSAPIAYETFNADFKLITAQDQATKLKQEGVSSIGLNNAKNPEAGTMIARGFAAAFYLQTCIETNTIPSLNGFSEFMIDFHQKQINVPTIDSQTFKITKQPIPLRDIKQIQIAVVPGDLQGANLLYLNKIPAGGTSYGYAWDPNKGIFTFYVPIVRHDTIDRSVPSCETICAGQVFLYIYDQSLTTLMLSGLSKVSIDDLNLWKAHLIDLGHLIYSGSMPGYDTGNIWLDNPESIALQRSGLQKVKFIAAKAPFKFVLE